MRASITVDLAAFSANLAAIRRRIAPAAHMLVVKDDAYGHGLAPLVRRAHRDGISWFGAFDVPTGLAVRELAGEHARVFVWLVAGPAEAREAVEAGLDIGVGDEELLADVAAVASPSTPARVHLKIDTGLRRNGIPADRWAAAIERAATLSERGMLRVEGVWSHIAEASDAEDDRARVRYEHALSVARGAGLRPLVRHLSASAAGFARPEFRYDLARIGAFAYGIRSAGGPTEDALGLRPIATVTAPVIEVHGDDVRVGLGGMDGLPSALGGRMSVGTPAGPRRLVRIAPDRSVVEGWHGARVGDVVRILGRGAPHSATDVAERIDTIGEEIALRIFPGLPREYR